MKAVDGLKARLGGNMRESVGAYRPDPNGAVASSAEFQGNPAERGASRLKNALAIELTRIMGDPDQPRKEFDEAELDELAASLKRFGQLQTCEVRYHRESDKYIIVS